MQIIPPNWGVSYHFDWPAYRSRLPSRTIYRVPIKLIWQAPTRWYYLHKPSFVRYVTITKTQSFSKSWTYLKRFNGLRFPSDFCNRDRRNRKRSLKTRCRHDVGVVGVGGGRRASQAQNRVAWDLIYMRLDVYIMYICFYIITDFVFIFELVPCKSCNFNNLLTEAGVMHEAGYVDSIWST